MGTESISALTAVLRNALSRFERSGRKCVLAIKSFKDNAIDITHPVFKALQRKGVIIITDLQQIKNLR
ncbi:hypothetical protein [Flavobacterium davisii]|uniref:hypothetical protein n=1 Tax=Flavobacterium davisii TaxID=2906077 RepID=UPI0035CF162E